MAIDFFYASYLHKFLSAEKECDLSSRNKCACLSYPDLVVTENQLRKILSLDMISKLDRSSFEKDIKRWHGINNSETIYSTESFLRVIGLDPDFFDLQTFRGIEQKINLNDPLPESLIAQYKFVIDTGTLEHCFNVGQAFKNMCSLLCLGGVAFSMAPLNIVNHGFWNFSPTAFYDGFVDNGFEIISLLCVTKNQNETRVYELKEAATRRVRLPENSVVFCCAKKIKLTEFCWPTQTKYKSLLT